MGRITRDDRVLVRNLRIEKNWSSRKLIAEFPNKAWSRASLDRLIKKIDTTGAIDRKPGGGRPKSARTNDNIALVSELICSQDNNPHSHKSPCEIERDTGISRATVRRIAKHDLKLNTYKRIIAPKLNADCRMKRLQRSQQLLTRFPNDRSVCSVWFTDKKSFTVATPVNAQNDRVYSEAACKKEVDAKRILREREHFSRNVMVSVGVSRMGKTSVVFVEPGAKINSDYYCNRVLGQGLIPDIRARCLRHSWTLQQDGAPSHTARNTISYLQRENIDFIEPGMWPPNSPDLNPVDYAIWGALQHRIYLRRKFTTVEQLKLTIVEEWGKLSQRFIDNSINEWRQRLERVVQLQGGHIEHSLA